MQDLKDESLQRDNDTSHDSEDGSSDGEMTSGRPLERNRLVFDFEFRVDQSMGLRTVTEGVGVAAAAALITSYAWETLEERL